MKETKSDKTVDDAGADKTVAQPQPRLPANQALPEDRTLADDRTVADARTVADVRNHSNDLTVGDDRTVADGRPNNPPSNSSDAMTVSDAESKGTQDAPDAFADSFLSTPAMPTKVDRYFILSMLGEGGMGAVYKAEQREPIRRFVALKLIRLGQESGAILARFNSERQALARMDHPNIAKVLDAGTTEHKLPFFVMEYVPGKPITDFADQNHLTLEARLKLFLQVCDAVGHAHSKALLHRDIKAQNVLAYFADGELSTKVIDFGIAKAVGEEKLTDVAITAGIGAVIGTPYAMSPEQAEGSADIDTRTDIYALGVLLYELLGGRLPFEMSELKRRTMREVTEIIQHKDAPKLSEFILKNPDRAEKIAKDRSTRPATLARDLKKELEWIPLKAMRKDRDRRYQSALQLTEDIQNYLHGRPLTAGPESAVYRFRKFVGRNKLLLSSTAAVILFFTLGVAAYTINMRIERDHTEAARKTAQGMVDFSKAVFLQASPEEGGKADVTVTEAMEKALADISVENRIYNENLEQRAGLRAQIGAILRDAGAYQLAETQLSQALNDSKKFMPPTDIRLAEMYCDLGSTQQKLHATAEARKNYLVALDIYSKAYPDGAVSNAETMNNIGTCFLEEKDYKQATKQFDRTYDLLKKVGIREKTDLKSILFTATLLNNLGIAAFGLKQYETAIDDYQNSLSIREHLLKPDDVEIAESKMNIGDVLAKTNRFESAVEPLEQSLAIYRAHGGDDWPKTLLCRLDYAAVMRGVGRLDEAVKQYRMCIDGLSKRSPEMDENLAAARSGLGRTLMLLPGRLGEVEPLLKASFEYRLAHNDPMLPTTADALTRYYSQMGQPEKAQAIQDQVVNYTK